jgi:hypothetical protein
MWARLKEPENGSAPLVLDATNPPVQPLTPADYTRTGHDLIVALYRWYGLDRPQGDPLSGDWLFR